MYLSQTPAWYQRLEFESELQGEIGRAAETGYLVSIVLLTPKSASRSATRALFRLANAVLVQAGGFAGLLGDGDWVLCLPDTGRAEATELAQSIQVLMEPGRVNESVATFPADGGTLAQLLTAAKASKAPGSPVRRPELQ